MFIGIMLFCLSVGVGIALKSINYNKIKFKLDLINFCDNLKTQISFSQKPLKEILEEYKTHSTKELNKILSQYINALGTDNAFAIESNLLTFEEKQILNELFSGLGRSETKNQIELCENAKGFLNNNYQNFKQKYQKTGDICLKLSICFGVLMVILVL